MPSSTPASAIPYALDADARAAWPGTSKDVAERLEVLRAADAGANNAALADLAARATALEGKTDLTDVFVGAVWGTGWAMSAMSATAMGHLVFIAGTATRSGGNITPGVAGDITPNLTLVTLDLGGRIPMVPVGLASAGGRRGCFFNASSDSGSVKVELVAVTGTSANFDTGDVCKFAGMFLSAVPG